MSNGRRLFVTLMLALTSVLVAAAVTLLLLTISRGGSTMELATVALGLAVTLVSFAFVFNAYRSIGRGPS